MAGEGSRKMRLFVELLSVVCRNSKPRAVRRSSQLVKGSKLRRVPNPSKSIYVQSMYGNPRSNPYRHLETSNTYCKSHHTAKQAFNPKLSTLDRILRRFCNSRPLKPCPSTTRCPAAAAIHLRLFANLLKRPENPLCGTVGAS